MGADANSQTLVQRHNLDTLSAHADRTESFDFSQGTSQNKTDSVQTDKDQHAAELQRLREIGSKTPILPSQIGTDFSFKREIVWKNLIGFVILHLFALYGTIITFQNVPSYKTTIYCEWLFNEKYELQY